MNAETDMRPIIVAKSDQMNAEDLVTGPLTITITDAKVNQRAAEQPVTIRFEGDRERPWKPCKNMSRVLVGAWGPDSSTYTGKSLTLYRDPDVTWAGEKVGGIRISHMSDIGERSRRFVIIETRGRKKGIEVKPISQAPKESFQTYEPKVAVDGPKPRPENGWSEDEPSVMDLARDRIAKVKGQKSLHAARDFIMEVAGELEEDEVLTLQKELDEQVARAKGEAA